MANYLINSAVSPAGVGSRMIGRCSNGQLWCVYLEGGQLWVSDSNDGGVTWGSEQLTYAPAAPSPPSLAIDSQNNIHLAWGDTSDIKYRRRTPTGWEAEVNLTASVGAESRSEPSIAVASDDSIHVVWRGNDVALPGITRYIFYRQWIPAGWGAIETVIFNPTRAQFLPQIAIDDSNIIHVLWAGGGWGVNPLKNNIQYIERVAGIWQPRETVTDVASHQDSPSIALDSTGNIHTTWSTGANVGAYRRRSAAGVWDATEYPSCIGATISLDRTDAIFLIGTSGPGTGMWYVKKEGGVWESAVDILVSGDIIGGVLLWANHPTIAGVKTNVTEEGLDYVYQYTTVGGVTNLYYYRSYSLPIIINKGYALAREEL